MDEILNCSICLIEIKRDYDIFFENEVTEWHGNAGQSNREFFCVKCWKNEK